MKQLAVISGKGGTGKTSVVASLVQLIRSQGASIVAADCDVDAANLALLLEGEDYLRESFHAGRRARIDPDRCIECGLCSEHCHFDAIHTEPATAIRSLACEGCGVCALVCPAGAVRFVDNQAGWTMQRSTSVGPLVHARLGVAQDNSGKLVAAVRAQARQLAAERGADLVLIDGPPGIGCPVHAALTGCDLALVVTEPTLAAEHDLRRVLRLCDHFRLRAAALINKYDLDLDLSAQIAALADRHAAPIVGRLPFDAEIPRALGRGETPLALGSFREGLVEAWTTLQPLFPPELGRPPTAEVEHTHRNEAP